MTHKKIDYAWKKIKTCEEQGFVLEALLKNYHLNVELVNYILESCSETYSPRGKKIKVVLHAFMDEVEVNPRLKAVLNKRNVKSLWPWLQKMEQFFKTLKMRRPVNTRALLLESEKIFAMLHISAAKLFAQNAA